MRVGVLTSFQFRSIFYELDKPLPYYPFEPLIPAFELESVQLNPFLSWEGRVRGLSSLGWTVQAGPVFSFNGGDYFNISTAISNPGNSYFLLYLLDVTRQPIGIPFFRTQASLSFSGKLGARARFGIHPFIQLDLGDRSRALYRLVPDDPINVSTGTLRSGIGSFGFSCSFSRSR